MNGRINTATQSLPGLAESAWVARSRFTGWLLAGLFAGLLAVGIVRGCEYGFTLLVEGLAQSNTPDLNRPL